VEGMEKKDKKIQKLQKKLQTEKDLVKSLQDDKLNHKCSNICQETCCLGDYTKLQEQKRRLEEQLTTQEKEIIQKLNLELHLGLKNKPDLNQVITTIQELIKKPDGTDCQRKLANARQLIKKLEQQKTPYGESLENIIKIDSQ